MAKKIERQVWAALDIGTTKICVIIAGLDNQGKIEVLGFGRSPSYGLQKGVVVNIDQTTRSIGDAVAQAQKMAGVSINAVTVGIAGSHIQSHNSLGVVPIAQRTVSQDDIDAVIHAAKAIALPADREIIHVLPQYFKVDGSEHIRNSLGVIGVRLEAQVHIITGSVAAVNDIVVCCQKAGLRVHDIVLEQLASAHAVLSEAEKEMGVAILDIGGGTSDFALYKEGRIGHSKVIPIAGSHCTNDVAIGLRISPDYADLLKRSYGFVYEERYFDLEQASLKLESSPEQARKEIDTYELYEILHPRASELFGFVLDEILTFRLRSHMPYGLVLTGGGSLLHGMRDLAESIFDMPVRIGLPSDMPSRFGMSIIPDVLRSPVYATGYGLLLHAINAPESLLSRDQTAPTVAKIFQRMKSWICDFI